MVRNALHARRFGSPIAILNRHGKILTLIFTCDSFHALLGSLESDFSEIILSRDSFLICECDLSRPVGRRGHDIGVDSLLCPQEVLL